MLIQIPAVEQSFLGGPDRQMMETAFKLRADLTGGSAEPTLFLDFDDRTLGRLSQPPLSPPPIVTPRVYIAQLLDFIRSAPPAAAPRVVVLDVDIAQAAGPGDQGVAELEQALAAWAATPTAPPLVIAREAFPTTTLGSSAPGLALPSTPYDAVVQQASNIYWSTVKVLADQNGVIREFQPFECVFTGSSYQPLYSAALLAYQFAERDPHALADAPSKHWMSDGAARCQSAPAEPLSRGERIDYHFSLENGVINRVWPNLSPDWAGFRQCAGADSAIFRRISVADVIDALRNGSPVSHALLCQHVVLIGGTNAAEGDFVQTPLNEMNGSVVLANSIRGLELTRGGLRPIPLIFQVGLLLLVSLTISVVAAMTDHARRQLRTFRRSRQKETLLHHLSAVGLNPIILNGIIALAAHCAGVGLLFVSLNFGLWGFLSAPAFAAAIAETVQEFFDA